MKQWPRRRKLLFCIVVLLVSLFFISSIADWPSPTLEIAIHRAEKQQLIGPGEIIEKLDFADSSWDHLILSRTEHGYTTFEYQDSLGWDNGYLRYFENSPGATMFTTDYLYEQASGLPLLPIFLFPENQTAYSARMTLCVQCGESSVSFNLLSYREPGSCFMFSLPAGPELKPECYWLLQQAISNSYQEYDLTGTVEIHINFYNRQGNLVDTYSKTVTK
jgi:hypothetical protein